MVRASLTLLVGAAVLASGCGSKGDSVGWPTVVEPPPCGVLESSSLITERRLKRAFAKEGITLYRDDSCAPDVLVSLTNQPIGAGAPVAESDRIDDEQGHVICDLYAGDGSARLQQFVWRNDSRPVIVRVLNVDCAVYPHERADRDSVERELRTLPGVSGAPAGLPSGDAVPD